MNVRIAILDLYEGYPNQGMRCLRDIIRQWSEFHAHTVHVDEFEVRIKQEVPDLNYDIYISTGGPGSPIDSEGSDWERAYFGWLRSVESWNNNPHIAPKKFVFLICHSFQLVCRDYGIAEVCKRKSTSFGVFPVHITPGGHHDSLFKALNDPFYIVDSRDWQVIHPDWDLIRKMGAHILCIEKYRPHVPYVQAIMGMRFSPWMVGTQFHPEADAPGMSAYLQNEQRKEMVIEQHGLAKWESMVEQLNDPDKIMWTYAHVLPNFLDGAVRHLTANPTHN
ncbi:type 1 glutamine amidotransferase [Paracnuella aquatica]|uniref:type 1 glutamine amidotransferase n=1 Tax=Paracnuella aquatica TaxID=2268757 RepID=UPI000DEEB6A8|nr:GMP synthase [Paracnuella aquatica]RPD51933.1 GMP synthase [Paracnuella aquatica]